MRGIIRKMITPRLPFPKSIMWVLSALVVFGLPLTSWVYWPAVLEAGVLSPEADTIIIPMMNSVFLAILLIPLIGLTAWLSTRKSPRAIHLLAWNSDRPVLSAIVTLVFAASLGAGILLIAEELMAPWGWYGAWWIPYTLLVVMWLAFVRAAALSTSNTPRSSRSTFHP